MKQSTKYLLYAAGAYFVLTSGVLASAAVSRRLVVQDKAFQNYLTHLESRLNNFPYNLSQSSLGPVKITKGKSGYPGYPFYLTRNSDGGLAPGETHIDRWASDISWTY